METSIRLQGALHYQPITWEKMKIQNLIFPKIQNQVGLRVGEVLNIPLETSEKSRWNWGKQKHIGVKQRIKKTQRTYKKKMKIHVRPHGINWNSSRKQNIYCFPKGLISVSLDTSSHAKTIYYCSLKISAKYKYSKVLSIHGKFIFLKAKINQIEKFQIS